MRFIRLKILTAVLLLAVLMAAIDAAPAFNAVPAFAATRSISQLRKEKAEYERQKKEINEKINTLEFERMAEIEKKAILDERIVLTGMEIKNLDETIKQYNMLISEKEYEIIVATNREEEQLRKYISRVRFLEENGTVTYLEVLFDSASFLDLMARVDFISKITRADEEAYIALQQARETTEASKDELDDIKAELNNELGNMETLKAELDKQLEEAHALILKMENDLEKERKLYEWAQEEENRVQKEIYALEAELRRQREAERQAQLLLQQQQQEQQQQEKKDSKDDSGQKDNKAAAPAATGTGELMWPIAGAIISNYGMRGGRMHQGIDIGASHGAAIVAADGGTVITSSSGSGYGQYIVISHGNGMTTLYAHLSSRGVSVGDVVAKGQYIGGAGSTGNATVTHLHFEVSVDGVRVNPISKL